MNLYDAVHEMRKSNVPFSIEYVTYSRDRNEGGKRLKLENVLCAGQLNNQQHDMLQGFKRVDDPENHVQYAVIFITYCITTVLNWGTTMIRGNIHGSHVAIRRPNREAPYEGYRTRT